MMAFGIRFTALALLIAGVCGATSSQAAVKKCNGIAAVRPARSTVSRRVATQPTHVRKMSDKKMARRDITQTAVGPGMQTVTTLVKAVQAAELVDALRGPGPFTVFAPTNDAFAKLPPSTIAMLLKPENKDKLRSILLYHVHAGEAVTFANLRNGKIPTLNGKTVGIKVDGPTVMVNNATITKSDVMASNGVIHWLDTVILP